jgi:hypothetical protein
MKVKSILSSLLVIASLAVSAIAQTSGSTSTANPSTGGTITTAGRTPTAAEALQGGDTLREYALGQVVHGYRDVTSESLVYVPNQPTWVEAKGTSAEDVLDKLFKTEIIYELANPSDKIHGRIWLYDGNDRVLFYGSSEYFAADIGKVGPVYSIWIQNVPLFNNVQFAEILALNADGVTADRIQMGLVNDQISFSSGFAGVPNGILSIRFKDNTVVTYNLWEPVAKAPAGIEESSPTWQISGHHVIPATEKDVVLVSFIETWELPTVYIPLKATQSIKFDVLGVVYVNGVATFERPISYKFTMENGSLSGDGLMAGDQPTLVKIPAAGKFRIKFDWNKYGKPGAIYTGPKDTTATTPVTEKGI